MLALPRLGSRTDDDSSMVNIFSLSWSLLAVSHLRGMREGSLEHEEGNTNGGKKVLPSAGAAGGRLPSSERRGIEE